VRFPVLRVGLAVQKVLLPHRQISGVVRGTGIWRVHRPYTNNADFPKHFRRSLDWRVWQVCVYQRNNYGGVVCLDVGIEDDSGGEEGDMKSTIYLRPLPRPSKDYWCGNNDYDK